MGQVKRVWHYLIAEPFTWIFYCFFQPARFKREFEITGAQFWKRIIPMLRLAIPMFLVSYPLVLTGQMIFLLLHLISYSNATSFLLDPALCIAFGIAGGIAFICSYIVGFYRLPLYPISGLSGFSAYIASRINPTKVFTYLHNSSLHWDEKVYLPLPYLRQTLLIAIDEDVKKTLKEINFIVAERPQQIQTARAAALEITMRDLESRKSLAEIAGISQRLAEILPLESRLIDPQWATVFARLQDASKDAARCCSPIGRQARRNALIDVKTNLEKIHPNVTFRGQKLNSRLGKVIATWSQIIQQKQEELERSQQDLGKIDNPYKPGLVLHLSDSSFVGRSDLARHLAEALGRRDHNPTFLLHGERRMGKSSTLIQLPRLLGSHYLPIFYDLQNSGITATIATFLDTLSKEIYSTLNTRGIKVKQLTYEVLKDAYKENEAAVYHEFNNWLDGIERALEREDRMLLLAFDEFEKLEEGQQGTSLDLRILLNWFRYTIQHRPRLAILFSGVHTINEMGTETGINWASYFVNVQTLHVGFLHIDEARQLITEPVPNFPSDDIFGTGVVDKIISETGCHPFLVQAVCSALIDNLNADKREVAEFKDAIEAVEQVLESWHNYFSDLWVRTDEEQRACLAALRTLERANLYHLTQLSGLDEQIVRRTLQTLLKRDLVLRDKSGTYRIAVPIFGAWVERSLLQ